MMRIQEILLQNYRQYRNLLIKLDKKTDKNDLHIFIGSNDTGKTNLLNAINWCLYGDEPHLGEDKEEMPILNTKEVKLLLENGGNSEVKVQVLATTDNNHKITFRRGEKFKIHPGNNTPILLEKKFEIFHTFPNDTSEIYSSEDAQDYVMKYIPQHLREFFFFDGEEIKEYFKREKAAQIQKHVFDLSNIDLLQGIEKRLDSCMIDIRRESSRLSPKLEKIEKILEGYETKIKSLEEICKNAEKQRDQYLRIDAGDRTYILLMPKSD